MPDKRYIIMLSEVDRLIVRQHTRGREVLQFSVQHEVLVASRWRKAVRFDSAHNTPHRHVFYPDGSEYKEFMTAGDNNIALTQALTWAKNYFRQVHERYRAMFERMVK